MTFESAGRVYQFQNTRTIYTYHYAGRPQIFSLPENDSAPRLLQTIILPEGIQEVVFIRDPCGAPIPSHTFSATLTALTIHGMSFFTLFRDPVNNIFCLRLTQNIAVLTPGYAFIWFNLRIDSTGRRLMWIIPSLGTLDLPAKLTLSYGVSREEVLDTTALVDRKIYCDIQDCATGSTATFSGFPHLTSTTH